MAYQSWSVVFGEQPSAAKWNILGTNDAFFNTQVGDDFSSGTNSTVWWEEIGRTTLGSAGDTITVSSIPARKYLKIIAACTPTGGTINGFLTLNGDTGANYSRRYSNQGAADTTDVSQTSMIFHGGTIASPMLTTGEVINIAASEKVLQFYAVIGQTAGAGTAPGRIEGVNKWVNTTNKISSITLTNTGTGDYAIGSEVIVLGHD